MVLYSISGYRRVSSISGFPWIFRVSHILLRRPRGKSHKIVITGTHCTHAPSPTLSLSLSLCLFFFSLLCTTACLLSRRPCTAQSETKRAAALGEQRDRAGRTTFVDYDTSATKYVREIFWQRQETEEGGAGGRGRGGGGGGAGGDRDSESGNAGRLREISSLPTTAAQRRPDSSASAEKKLKGSGNADHTHTCILNLRRCVIIGPHLPQAASAQERARRKANREKAPQTWTA